MAYGLTPAQAETLINLLGSDRDFHSRFEADPAAVLREMGMSTEMARCVGAGKLASMDEIAAASASAKITFSSTDRMGQNIHELGVSVENRTLIHRQPGDVREHSVAG